MSKLHKNLSNRLKFYNTWHQNKCHQFLHWTVVGLVSLACCLIIFNIGFNKIDNYNIQYIQPVQAQTTHPIWNPTGDIDDILDNQYGVRWDMPLVKPYTPPEQIVTKKVSEYLDMSQSELRDQIDTSGMGPDPSRTLNVFMPFVVYDLSLLYHLTGEQDYAHRAAILLDEYANDFPYWPNNYEGRPGIWTDWFHHDLHVARKLPEAYDLIYNSGAFDAIGPGTRDKVKNLLILIIQEDFISPLYTFNQAGYRPLGIVIFGRVLEDPELVHLGYWFHNKMLHEGYSYDGFWFEGSYQYSLISLGFLDKASYRWYFNGYSDPPGYTHVPFDVRWDPVRIDNYDVDTHFSDMWNRMDFSFYDVCLPNQLLPIMHDTEYLGYIKYRDGKACGPPPESYLMGGLGYGILAWGSGSNQVQARLDFTHFISHGHYDATHLIYFDKGTEAVGGTGYSHQNPNWNRSTINQNLVVVNEQQQKGSTSFDKTISPYIPPSSRNPVTRQVLSPNTNRHNNLVLWEPGYQTFKDVQVTEVDALDAYDQIGATRYQRMLGLVNINNNDVYLIDFFRTKGGTQYDWNLHGGHDIYSLSTDLSMTGTSGSFGQMTLTNQASTDNNWSGILDYGTTKHKIIMAGKPNTTVYKGTGLRSVQGGGNQDYVVARRSASSSDEEKYLVVHETYDSSPHIQSVQELQFDEDPGTAIGLEITLDNGIVDYVIHTLDEGPNYPEHTVTGISNFKMKGKFAHVRTTNGEVTWMDLIQGESLSYGIRSMYAINGDYSYRGNITKVNRKEEGASENSFEFSGVSLPTDGSLNNKTLVVAWGNGWTWGYKIKNVAGNRIITDDEPGFNYDGSGGVYMHYFPVPEYLGLSNFSGPVTFKIAGSAVMDDNGGVIATGPSQSQSLPDITLTKSVDKSQAQSGDTLTYTIQYQNTSQSQAKNLVITDDIPAGTTYVADSASDNGVYDPTNDCITWTMPALAPSQSGQVGFEARVD